MTPILFSSQMIRSILSGAKTQTRRVIKPQSLHNSEMPLAAYQKCPYGTHGDLLWVRETWRAVELDSVDGILYAADSRFVAIENTIDAANAWCDSYSNGKHGSKWRPSIYMPRWASRITLEMTGVRVQRLQAISERDAIAEGIECHTSNLGSRHSNPTPIYPAFPDRDGGFLTAKAAFECLWDTINAKRGYSWHANPWVWVVNFKIVKKENR